MPPRANLDEYETYVRYNGQLLQLRNIETATNDTNVYPEQTYTFARVHPDFENNIHYEEVVNLEFPNTETDHVVDHHILGDFDGDANLENINAGNYTTTDNLDNIWRYNTTINTADLQPLTTTLTDEFKETLKPFIQEVLKEMLENEGFILGRLPGDK